MTPRRYPFQEVDISLDVAVIQRQSLLRGNPPGQTLLIQSPDDVLQVNKQQKGNVGRGSLGPIDSWKNSILLSAHLRRRRRDRFASRWRPVGSLDQSMASIPPLAVSSQAAVPAASLRADRPRSRWLSALLLDFVIVRTACERFVQYGAGFSKRWPGGGHFRASASSWIRIITQDMRKQRYERRLMVSLEAGHLLGLFWSCKVASAGRISTRRSS
ncbi:hypothetical protein JOL62DRAFT_81381 [Phyllosticta paracitricarpa]|uniref:Uncharacterized protein n=1 Tax=Phyllosticta paracitricarpa TaxID=2016321 RepID=A0ABR1N895_9PEZI